MSRWFVGSSSSSTSGWRSRIFASSMRIFQPWENVSVLRPNSDFLKPRPVSVRSTDSSGDSLCARTSWSFTSLSSTISR